MGRSAGWKRGRSLTPQAPGPLTANAWWIPPRNPAAVGHQCATAGRNWRSTKPPGCASTSPVPTWWVTTKTTPIPWFPRVEPDRAYAGAPGSAMNSLLQLTTKRCSEVSMAQDCSETLPGPYSVHACASAHTKNVRLRMVRHFCLVIFYRVWLVRVKMKN